MRRLVSERRKAEAAARASQPCGACRKAADAARIKQEREARGRRDIQVVEAYRQRPVLRVVAAQFGISHEAVRNILHRHNAPVRHRGSPFLPFPQDLADGSRGAPESILESQP
jgi:hypothetical protein